MLFNFSKSSILFVLTNFLRFFSIVGLILGFSAEILVLVKDFQGVAAQNAAATTYSNSVVHAVLPRLEPSSTRHKMIRMKRQNPTPNPPAGTTQGPTISGNSQPGCSAPIYIAGTEVPVGSTGIIFTTIYRIFSILIICTCFISEISPPFAFVQKSFEYCFPSLGENFGVGILGLIELFMSSSILSYAVNGLPQVAGWWLGVIGIFNMLFGLALSSKIKSARSLYEATAPEAPSNVRNISEPRMMSTNGRNGISISGPTSILKNGRGLGLASQGQGVGMI